MILKILLIAVCTAVPMLTQLHEDAYMSTPSMIAHSGYPVEKHYAITDDDYMLQLHRIPRGSRSIGQAKGPRRVVLLMSGLLGSSSDFVVMGPKRSLAYMLADAGYDVWMGNLRGDLYTKHKYMKRNGTQFWDYSYHEHGTYDLPATIDKILSVTKVPKLVYIGFSMGTTSYFVMMSMRPEYNEKVLAFVGLAPALYLNNLRPLVKYVTEMKLQEQLKSRGLHFMYVREDLKDFVLSSVCQTRIVEDNLCLRILFEIVGEDYDQADWERIPICFSKLQPASIKQLQHFSQLVLSGEFSEFSEKLDGKPYNISANRRPATIFYGENDQLVAKSQVMRLAHELKEAGTLNGLVRVPWHKFNHLDFIFAKDVHKLLNKNIIKLLPSLFEQRDYD